MTHVILGITHISLGTLHKSFVNTLEHMKCVHLPFSCFCLFPGGCASKWHTSLLLRFLCLPVPWQVNSSGPLCVVCPRYDVSLTLKWVSALFFDRSVVDLWCNVSFRCTAQRFSFICVYKVNVKVKSLSCVWLFVTPWTEDRQAPLSMGFSREEYWSGLPFPSPGDLSDPGTEPVSPALQADTLRSEPPGKPHIPIKLCVHTRVYVCMLVYSVMCDSLWPREL